MQPNITVFYNMNRMGMFRGLAVGDQLERVWEGRIAFSPDSTDLTVLANVFHKFNHVVPPGRKRSLSIGDVVTIEDRSYRCDPNGWTRLLAIATVGKFEEVADLNPKVLKMPVGRVAVNRDGYGRPIDRRKEPVTAEPPESA
jgi:hypothetical protein